MFFYKKLRKTFGEYRIKYYLCSRFWELKMFVHFPLW